MPPVQRKSSKIIMLGYTNPRTFCYTLFFILDEFGVWPLHKSVAKLFIERILYFGFFCSLRIKFNKQINLVLSKVNMS